MGNCCSSLCEKFKNFFYKPKKNGEEMLNISIESTNIEENNKIITHDKNNKDNINQIDKNSQKLEIAHLLQYYQNIPDQKDKINKIEIKEGKKEQIKIEMIEKKKSINDNSQKKKNNNQNNYNYQNNEKDKNNIIINKKCDYFTPKEIQINYRKIASDFEIFASNYFNDDDEIDNQTIGEFLFEVANISRISFNDSNKFLGLIYKEFDTTKNENEKIIISSINEFKEEFSSWVKNNNQIIEKKLEEFLNNFKYNFINEQKDKIKRDKFYKLYKDLLILYFQCELSLPSIEIDFNFNIKENFNNETMIDYAKNKGRKKVNFVFFPSLKSNGNYLQNGKQWVFTYNEKKKTFFIEKIELEPVIDKNNRFYIPMLKDKLKLNIINREKELIPNLNYKIDERVKKEYIFYLKNKNNSIERQVKSDSSIIIEENEELIECKLFLMSEYILSFP